MISLYLLDVEEWRPVIEVAARDGAAEVTTVGPYTRIASDTAIVIDRRQTGVRHAVWYSAVAALAGGTVVQHDKDALRILPA